jgi:aminopeptidase N
MSSYIRKTRKVGELVFFVTKEEYVEPSLFAVNDDLFNRMVEVFGITTNMARKIINTYEDDQILRNLDYTEQQFRKAIKNKKESQFNIGAYATSAITKDYAPKQPKLLTKVIEEKELKKKVDSNVITMKKKESDDLIKKITTLFEKIEKPIQDTLKLEFEKNGIGGPDKRLFDREGWCSDQICNHFFVFLTSQIEQGRKGQGYDQIKKLLIETRIH